MTMQEYSHGNHGVLQQPLLGSTHTNMMPDDDELKASKISDRVSPSLYYSYTIGLFLLQILFAILIDDITIIFGFFAAFSESIFNFILPGIFYIRSC